ncbi:MAG TPA: hypothetical protein VMW24_23375 [Sedimentisphaerales bacterium]|nr:hypothetical protein [Sedimentisphaerales bacterium]
MSEQPTINRPAVVCQEVMDMKDERIVGPLLEAMKSIRFSIDLLREETKERHEDLHNEMHGQREADQAIMKKLNETSQRLTKVEMQQEQDRIVARRRLTIWAIVSPILAAVLAWALMAVQLFVQG